MQAVVLAAGRGSRLRPLTDERPKALVEVGGEPILTHTFETLRGVGVEEAVVVVGYLGEAIVDRYGDAYGDLDLTYARQPERRGLADALLAAAEYVSDRFLLTYGDYLFGTDVARVLERHRDRNPSATVLVDRVDPERATDFGVFEFEGDRPVGLAEKPDDPASNVVMTGFFCFEESILPAARVIRPSGRGEYELSDAIDLLLYAGHDVELVYADDWLVNVNDRDDLQRARRRMENAERRSVDRR